MRTALIFIAIALLQSAPAKAYDTVIFVNTYGDPVYLWLWPERDKVWRRPPPFLRDSEVKPLTLVSEGRHYLVVKDEAGNEEHFEWIDFHKLVTHAPQEPIRLEQLVQYEQEERLVQVQRLVPEQRTRTVNVQFTRPEERTRQVWRRDRYGRRYLVWERYTVLVPYTEQREITYTVQVPVWESKTVTYDVLVRRPRLTINVNGTSTPVSEFLNQIN